MRSHRDLLVRSVILQLCLACAAVLVLGIILAGCAGSTYTGPTNRPWDPFFKLVREDLPAAGITSLEAAEGPSGVAKKGELYLRVLGVQGQDASATADRLVSLVQTYKEQLHLQWLHVVIESAEGLYDHTFDLTSGPSSTS